MRILILTNELTRTSGWGTVSYYLARALEGEHTVHFLTEADLGVASFDKVLHLGPAFHQHRDRFGPLDLILCNVELYLPLAALLKRHHRARLVLIGHGTYVYYPFIRGWRRFYYGRFTRAIDRIVVPSLFTRERVRRWWSGPLDVVPWGVDTERYHPVPVAKEPVFVFVGHQKERKGVPVLLHAVAGLLPEFPELRLEMLGDPNPRYVGMARSLGMTEAIDFRGRVGHEELLASYSRSLCHVLPSVNTNDAFEGFGLVHLEANACGIPSVGSRGTANESVIEPGRNGFLVDPTDSRDLQGTLRTILKDRESSDRLGRTALEHARDNTWDRNLAPLVSTIREMAGDRPVETVQP